MSTSVGAMVESILIKENLYYIDAFCKKNIVLSYVFFNVGEMYVKMYIRRYIVNGSPYQNQ